MRIAVLLLIGGASCVAYDTAGPAVPRIDGTYDARIVIEYANFIELRTDTISAVFVLRDLRYRGEFAGTYRTQFGDSGRFAGVERPESTLVVSVFGTPPKPIAYVIGLRELYGWCDFSRLGTGPLAGRLRGDSLLVSGAGSLPCHYQLYDTPTEIGTELQLRIEGSRAP